ncbi:MAG: F0F1 ATP synthase subunit delta [Betaproteobacteria bacterium]
MAELATIARPYAEALFKSAKADLGGAAAWLDQFATIASNEQLLQFADSPKVTDAQVFDLISGVVKGALPDSAKNFLRVVIENGRVDALPEIAAQFRVLKNTLGGSSDATVYSAFPMDEKAVAELSGALEKRFGRKLNITVELDASLIGGIRVVVGDEVLDTSVKARLDQMKIALTA